MARQGHDNLQQPKRVHGTIYRVAMHSFLCLSRNRRKRLAQEKSHTANNDKGHTIHLACPSYLARSRDDRTRTGDPYVPNVVRYQLRYIPLAAPDTETIWTPPPGLRVQRYVFFLKHLQFYIEKFVGLTKKCYLCTRVSGSTPQKLLTIATTWGALAQVVEQWTENPCVLGSTPRGTTSSFHSIRFLFFARPDFFMPISQ